MSKRRTTPAEWTERRADLADAAIAVLATTGGRGLTHRAVDQQAGLPVGSASNLFRSREDLLVGALDRLIDGDFEALPAPDRASEAPSVDEAAARIVELIRIWTASEARPHLVARFELFLEATRRPEFAARLLERRERIVGLAAQLLPTPPPPAPRADPLSLVLWIEGVLLDALLDPTLVEDPAALLEMVRRQLMPGAD